MGLRGNLETRFRGVKKVAIDTAIYLYLFERHPRYEKILDKLFQFFEARHIEMTVSTLVLTELLVGPFRDKKEDIIQEWLSYFHSFPLVRLDEVSSQIAVQAAWLRSAYSLKTPDAIHISTALINECEWFITNDKNLKKMKEIKVLILSDLL